MRRILIVALFLALLPATVLAQSGENDEGTTASPPLPLLAIADYYDVDIATVQVLADAGIGYGLAFKLMGLVASGEATVDELVAVAQGNSEAGWGMWLRMARVSAPKGSNLGQAIRAYVHSNLAARPDTASNPADDSGRPEGAGPPPHAASGRQGGPPDHAGNGQGRGNGQGQGNGNGQGNGRGRDK